ncbi:MAG: fused MFS/spermidine synthase, partial [Hyphomicrobium sp.]
IDPVVVKLARDPKLFTFFSRCRPDAAFVLGDARLTLAKEPATLFDYLLIDAFSSDSIPVHLLTREALELYLSRLSPNGLLAFHVSNRHMDLDAVASTLVRSIPGISGVVVRDVVDKLSFASTNSNVVLIAKTPAVLADVASWKGAMPIGPLKEGAKADAAWTDDYSNVLGAILRKNGY